jgi:hypothetical protein
MEDSLSGKSSLLKSYSTVAVYSADSIMEGQSGSHASMHAPDMDATERGIQAITCRT